MRKLLDIFFDSKLTFQSPTDNICKEAAHKLNAISRITPYMDFNKRKLVVNTFFQHNLTTARWFGCAIIELIITK